MFEVWANSKKCDLKISNFPDGSLKCELRDFTYADYVIIKWRYENDAELFTLMNIKSILDAKGVSKTQLIMGYVPHARMDRTESANEAFTLKVFANVINSMKFCEVCCLDVHSKVAAALINNLVVYSPNYMIEDIDGMPEYYPLIHFFPDEGAMKRYSKNTRGIPYTFGIKNRDWQTGEIKSYEIINPELVKDKNVLIIDDICSRGTTFLRAAEGLRAAGAAHIYLCVSHAENTMYEGEMYNTPGLIDHIFTSNTIPVKSPNFDKSRVTIYNWM